MQEHPPYMEQEIGEVTHYWGRIGVAGIHLTEPLDVGDHIHILGRTSDFEQDVGSMQIDHQGIRHADPGQDIGVRVAEHAREHDKVFRMAPGGDIANTEHEL